jgi:hypothetical protein
MDGWMQPAVWIDEQDGYGDSCVICMETGSGTLRGGGMAGSRRGRDVLTRGHVGGARVRRLEVGVRVPALLPFFSAGPPPWLQAPAYRWRAICRDTDC